MSILGKEQEAALEAFKQGQNIFITGAAGSGKTFLIEAVVKYCSDNEIRTAVTAMTGVAAANIKGITLHSALGLPVADTYVGEELLKRLRSGWNFEVLIIDEVSMLSADLFEALEYCGRKLKKCERFFGGMQVLFSGDFLQLSPVKGLQAFKSRLWVENVKVFSFTAAYRQSEQPRWLEILSRLRLGVLNEEDERFIKSESLKEPGNNSIHISAKNVEVQRENVERFTELKKSNSTISYSRKFLKLELDSATSKNFGMEETEDVRAKAKRSIIGKFKLKLKLQPDELDPHAPSIRMGDYPTTVSEEYRTKAAIPKHDEFVELCVGCKVMCLENKPQYDVYNGSIGIVKNVTSKGASVTFTGGSLVFIPYTLAIDTFSVPQQEKILATGELYLPLRLAWASTAHKTQGLTLDCGSVDMKSAFAAGHVYTVLSRFKKLSNIYFATPITQRMVIANQDALDYYNSLLP